MQNTAQAQRYRGVTWHKADKLYRVRLHVGNQYIYFGYYEDPKLAAQVYDVAACMALGPRAKLNFSGRLPDGVTETQILQPLIRKGYDVQQLRKNWHTRLQHANHERPGHANHLPTM
jgi:hypothetical protein